MSGADLPAGTCRFCGCQEHSPCEGGCAWTDETQTLCTACLGVVAIAIELVKALGIVAATPKAGLHLMKGGSWDALALEQQRLIVNTCRVYFDAVQNAVIGELGEQAQANGEELDSILAYLLERCPDELRRVPDTSLADVVIRLLEPHVGSRILLPGARV